MRMKYNVYLIHRTNSNRTVLLEPILIYIKSIFLKNYTRNELQTKEIQIYSIHIIIINND